MTPAGAPRDLSAMTDSKVIAWWSDLKLMNPQLQEFITTEGIDGRTLLVRHCGFVDLVVHDSAQEYQRSWPTVPSLVQELESWLLKGAKVLKHGTAIALARAILDEAPGKRNLIDRYPSQLCCLLLGPAAEAT